MNLEGVREMPFFFRSSDTNIKKKSNEKLIFWYDLKHMKLFHQVSWELHGPLEE